MPDFALTRSASSSRRGAALIYVALLMLLIIGFIGLALDSSYVLSTKQQLQAAADAASLAAAAQVESDPTALDPNTPYSVTRNAALQIALLNQAAKQPIQLAANYPNNAGGDVVIGVWDSSSSTFTASTVGPNAVQVTARRAAGAGGGPLDLIFGPLFQKQSVDISRTAIATSGAVDDAVILILDPSGSEALALKGAATMSAPGGKVQVNSTHAGKALYLNGPPNTPRLTAQRVNVVGGASHPTGSVVPVPITGSPVVPDYLMYLPDHPDPSGTLPSYGAITGAGTYNPGRYPNGIDFTDGQALLNPGVYVIGPPGIKLVADAQLVGTDVMLFIDLGGDVTISGQGVAGMDLSAPSNGLYQGVVIYQHRQNTAQINIQGGGLFDLRGTIYSKNGGLEMDGHVHREVGRIVVFRQLVRGTADYVITGFGPPPTGPESVFLVQ